MAQEVELKFEGDRAALSALRAHPRLVAVAADTVALRSVYFDAPDARLWKAGLSLRVRQIGPAYVQTVKASHGSLIARSEWEHEIAGPALDAAALADTPAGKLLRSADDIEPLFSVTVERTVLSVKERASEIEVALDEGRIVCGDGCRSEPVSEIELELKKGSASDLFALARALSSHATIRLGVRSKAERGYSFIAGEGNEVSKGEPVLLSKDMNVADAFQAIAQSCLRHMRMNEAILLCREDPEALHQTRVAVRRLRSAMSLFGAVIADEQSETVASNLKRLVEPLGRARNLDVFRSHTLPRARKDRPDDAALLALAKKLEEERLAAYGKVAELLRSETWRSAILDTLAWINTGAWLAPRDKAHAMRLAQPARSFANDVLKRHRRKVEKRGRHLHELDATRRHKVRIAAKKLRYGSEFFATLYEEKKKLRRRHDSFVAALKELQDVLGSLNDISTGRELVSSLADDMPHVGVFVTDHVSGEGDPVHASLLKKARAAHEAFVDARPFWR